MNDQNTNPELVDARKRKRKAKAEPAGENMERRNPWQGYTNPLSKVYPFTPAMMTYGYPGTTNN